MMYMAGIYSEDFGFAVITRKATDAVAQIHNRMPVIMPSNLADARLHESADVIGSAFTDVAFYPVFQQQMSLF